MQRTSTAVRAAFALCLAVAAGDAYARVVSGQLELVASRRQAVTPSEVSDGVVYFLPAATAAAPPRAGRFSVDTHTKGFLPSTLVVPAGSVVAFPNRDRILHNVYARSPAHTFDLGVYGPGEVRETRFERPGLVQVNCNVHPGMRANVLVLGTPHFARPLPDGSFRLDNVPEGEGTLVFWHPRSNAESRPVAARGNVRVSPVALRAQRAGVATTVRP